MPTQMLMEKLEDALHPADQAAIEAMRQVPERSIVKIQFSIPRNVRHHRMFFALINLVWQAQREPRTFATRENLLDALKIATGHVREVRDLQGRTHIVPDSISFGRLDNIAFKEFFDSAVKVISERVLPGVSKKDLEQQIFDSLQRTRAEQMRDRMNYWHTWIRWRGVLWDKARNHRCHVFRIVALFTWAEIMTHVPIN